MGSFELLSKAGRVYGFSLLSLVASGCFIQGFRCFPWMAVSIHLLNGFKVDPGTLQVILTTVNLPMIAKPIYGAISDSVYIGKAHRVPYLIAGALLQFSSWSTIVFIPSVSSSVATFSVFLALGNLGASVVEVANDALVAECGKRKKSTGELQSLASFSTAAGGLLGNLLGAFAMNRVDYKTMYTVFLAVLIVQILQCCVIDEGSLGLRAPRGSKDENEEGQKIENPLRIAKRRSIASNGLAENGGSQVVEDDSHQAVSQIETRKSKLGIRYQLKELYMLGKQTRVLFPLLWFVSSVAIVPTLIGVVFVYQIQVLQIDLQILGFGKVVGQVGLLLATVLYGRFCKTLSLRKLLGSAQVLISFCMLSDILLVKRVNIYFGIPDNIWVLGGSAFVDALGQFKALPFMVYLASVCPEGSEASLMALFASALCFAGTISGYLGATLASLLHLSSSDFHMLPVGIAIQAIAALLPLLGLSFVPVVSRLQSGRMKSI